MRIIDADELYKEINSWKESVIYKDWVQSAITHSNTIDAKPVEHGKWIKGNTFTPSYRCSCCGYSIFEVAGENIIQPKRNYCSNCGAKMDGEDE